MFLSISIVLYCIYFITLDTCFVPHDSILGEVVLSLYATIWLPHLLELHCYADDYPLYLLNVHHALSASFKTDRYWQWFKTRD